MLPSVNIVIIIKIIILIIIIITSNDQRLESVFDDLNCRLSLLGQVGNDMSSAPANSAEDARYAPQDPFIHGNQRCPIQSRLQSVLLLLRPTLGSILLVSWSHVQLYLFFLCVYFPL